MLHMNTITSVNKNTLLPLKTIAWAGLLVGTLDMLAAIVNVRITSGKGPVVIFQYIASAVFGKEAFGENSLMPSLGLIFHFIIAYIFTIILFIIYPKLKLQRFHPILVGIVYGIAIWIAMNVVVVPLSKIGKFNFKLSNVFLQSAILITMIGIPLSFICRKYYLKEIDVHK